MNANNKNTNVPSTKPDALASLMGVVSGGTTVNSPPVGRPTKPQAK